MCRRCRCGSAGAEGGGGTGAGGASSEGSGGTGAGCAGAEGTGGTVQKVQVLKVYEMQVPEEQC